MSGREDQTGSSHNPESPLMICADPLGEAAHALPPVYDSNYVGWRSRREAIKLSIKCT